MLVERIDVFAFKIDHHYQIGGHTETPGRLPGTDYYIEPQWPHAYSRKAESCLVKMTTDSGIVGWGEASAPLVPEVTVALIAKLVGPATIGQNPIANEALYDRLYHLMDVRGHTSGFMLDAIAAVDIAAWDVKGKYHSAPICELLGGPLRTELPAYVSGLRQPTVEERLSFARQKINDGFAGVKLFVGNSVAEVAEEFAAVSDVLGTDGFVAVDLICKYSLDEARCLARILDDQQAKWIEAPLNPDDIEGHRTLAASISTPVAIGEHLRCVQEFLPWFRSDALAIAQPDVPRTGITAARKIAELADAFQRKTALHIGLFSAIGMAATWQVAAALPNFLVQEHQFNLFGSVNGVLLQPLVENAGLLSVPMNPGLGIDVNEQYVSDNSVEHWIVDHQGARRGDRASSAE